MTSIASLQTCGLKQDVQGAYCLVSRRDHHLSSTLYHSSTEFTTSIDVAKIYATLWDSYTARSSLANNSNPVLMLVFQAGGLHAPVEAGRTI